MKIRIGKTDAHHRISSGQSMAYFAGSEYDKVPSAIAKALEKAGLATIINTTEPAKDK